MDEYECTGCSYKYSPNKGDETRLISPGTSFENLPDDWACPDCGAGKLGFRRIFRAGARKDKGERLEDDQHHIDAEQVGWKSSINR